MQMLDPMGTTSSGFTGYVSNLAPFRDLFFDSYSMCDSITVCIRKEMYLSAGSV